LPEARPHFPLVCTEQGVAILSSLLRNDRAIQVNIAIMHAFAKLRELLATHQELAGRLEELEQKFHNHDRPIREVFDAIRALLALHNSSKRRIGFPVQASQQK
jgi:hypothetical protein